MLRGKGTDDLLCSVPRYGYLGETLFVQVMIPCLSAGAEHGRYGCGRGEVASSVCRVGEITFYLDFARLDCHSPYLHPELVW
jgi:hypothetical protein